MNPITTPRDDQHNGWNALLIDLHRITVVLRDQADAADFATRLEADRSPILGPAAALLQSV